MKKSSKDPTGIVFMNNIQNGVPESVQEFSIKYIHYYRWGHYTNEPSIVVSRDYRFKLMAQISKYLYSFISGVPLNKISISKHMDYEYKAKESK